MDKTPNGKIGIVVWEKRAVLLSAFGLVGFGALVGAGTVYILYVKNRIEEHLQLQSVIRSQINAIQEDVDKLKASLAGHGSVGSSSPGTNENDHVASTSTRQTAIKKKRKSNVRVTFVEGTKSDAEDDEYITASASSESEYDEDAVVVFRNRKKADKEDKEEPERGEGEDETGDHAHAREDGNMGEFFRKIDRLFEGTSNDQHEAFVTLKLNEDKLADTYEFWWRFAKGTHLEATVAGQQNDKELQKDLLEKASAYAEKALKLNELSMDAHKWYAITIGSRGEFLKMNEKIQNGYVFKSHIDRAIELKPTEYSLHHLLGRFCFEVSQLSWVERRVAATLFSEPPSSSTEEALEHFLNAEKLGKPFIENRLFIGKCYISLGDYAKAAHWLNIASQIPITTSNERSAHAIVMELLPKYRRYLNP